MKEFLFIALLTFIFLSCRKEDTASKTPDTKKDTAIMQEDGKKKAEIKKDTLVPAGGNNDKKNSMKYAVSKYFTPVLYTKDFSSVYGGRDGKTLKRAKNGLIKELEYVAYPGNVFEILEEYKHKDHSIYKVFTKEYDVRDLNIDLYIDSRFVETSEQKPEERKILPASKEDIYKYFDKSVGALYVWGANNLDGVEKMAEYYPPSGKLSEKENNEWIMRGVDCSGLLYEATNGYTARNTHELVYFGDAVKIEGKSASQITAMIEPLDIIVWKGHVILVYDENNTIESSKSAGGVVKKNLLSVIKNVMSGRTAVNEWNDNGGKQFVIRRWFK